MGLNLLSRIQQAVSGRNTIENPIEKAVKKTYHVNSLAKKHGRGSDLDVFDQIKSLEKKIEETSDPMEETAYRILLGHLETSSRDYKRAKRFMDQVNLTEEIVKNVSIHYPTIERDYHKNLSLIEHNMGEKDKAVYNFIRSIQEEKNVDYFFENEKLRHLIRGSLCQMSKDGEGEWKELRSIVEIDEDFNGADLKEFAESALDKEESVIQYINKPWAFFLNLAHLEHFTDPRVDRERTENSYKYAAKAHKINPDLDEKNTIMHILKKDIQKFNNEIPQS